MVISVAAGRCSSLAGGNAGQQQAGDQESRQTDPKLSLQDAHGAFLAHDGNRLIDPDQIARLKWEYAVSLRLMPQHDVACLKDTVIDETAECNTAAEVIGTYVNSRPGGNVLTSSPGSD